MAALLREHLTFGQAGITMESIDAPDGKTKNLFLKGICIQGNKKNLNERIYPAVEIQRAVESIRTQIKSGFSVLGELDHPPDLKINLERVTHCVEDMWMDGDDGHGKLKILPTPMGNIVKTMFENGVHLGVSSRGAGDVDNSTGKVSQFEILTVDIVAQPSAPNAYPTAIYEGLMNMRGGHNALEVAAEATFNPKVQKYLNQEITRLIRDLKL